jgi:hypothetical protein
MSFETLKYIFGILLPIYLQTLLNSLKMARKKKDIDINIDTKNVDIKIKRKNGKFEASVDTPIIDVEITKDEENGLDVDVTADEKAPKILGQLIARIIKKSRG